MFINLLVYFYCLNTSKKYFLEKTLFKKKCKQKFKGSIVKKHFLKKSVSKNLREVLSKNTF